jgi:hypothetical protein
MKAPSKRKILKGIATTVVIAMSAIVHALLPASLCSEGKYALRADSVLSPAAQNKPVVLRTVDGIPGWTRTGEAEIYTKEGLYGYIDGGAEIVLQYGFQELAVFRFKPAAAQAVPKELVLEIYRMETGEAAFGLYSTKVEGDEKVWPGIDPDHWISPGQANLVKGEYMVNILAPACTEREIGEFAAALEPKIPGKETIRPAEMSWLPREGMVGGSGRYIKGALAAQNESPLLEPAFWGFGEAEAFSAKYGAANSKLVLVKFKTAPEAGTFEDKILAAFKTLLKDIKAAGGMIEGKNELGRFFLFGLKGEIGALVLGEPDEAAARTRLREAFINTARRWRPLIFRL